MLSLLGSLLGFGTSFLPKVMDYFQDKQDKKHAIGYGSTRNLSGNRITMDDEPVSRGIAEQLVQMELRHVDAAISKLIKVPLTQNQFDALASFTFNLGSGRLQSSTLRAKVNRLDYDGAADEFPKWRRAAGKILPGLVRRRAEERQLWLTT
jgi:lysozyme